MGKQNTSKKLTTSTYHPIASIKNLKKISYLAGGIITGSTAEHIATYTGHAAVARLQAGTSPTITSALIAQYHHGLYLGGMSAWQGRIVCRFSSFGTYLIAERTFQDRNAYTVLLSATAAATVETVATNTFIGDYQLKINIPSSTLTTNRAAASQAKLDMFPPHLTKNLLTYQFVFLSRYFISPQIENHFNLAEANANALATGGAAFSIQLFSTLIDNLQTKRLIDSFNGQVSNKPISFWDSLKSVKQFSLRKNLSTIGARSMLMMGAYSLVDKVTHATEKKLHQFF